MAQSQLEKNLEKHFKKFLDDEDFVHIKGNPQGLKGYPDRIVFAHEIFFVELKVGKEGGSYYKQQPMQKYWQRTIEGSKGNYVLITGRDEMRIFVDMLIREKRRKK